MSEMKKTENTIINAEMQAEAAVEQEMPESASHHHHRHHSKAYYKYRRIKHKIKKFFRSKQYRVLNTAAVIVLIIALVSVVIFHHTQTVPLPDNTSVQADENLLVQNNNYVGVKFPSFSQPQLLVEDVVQRFVESEEPVPLNNMTASLDKNKRLDIEKRVILSCDIDNIPSGVGVEKATVTLADNKNFNQPKLYNVTATHGSAELKFLETGKHYYYSIELLLSNGSRITAGGEFDTSESPRLISLDGVANVRDIGGWRTADGKTVKQGLLYRGCELDGVFEPAYQITDSGVSDVHKYLGIISDFDLRGLSGDVPQESAFGANIKHNIYDMEFYSGVFSSQGMTVTESLFRDLAAEENYPVYLHCTYGLDRTGTACFLLEALLGLSDEDLIREYELSCLQHRTYDIRDESSDFQKFLTYFYSLDGATSQEKAENYLLSCGLTKQEIENIKDILLE